MNIDAWAARLASEQMLPFIKFFVEGFCLFAALYFAGAALLAAARRAELSFSGGSVEMQKQGAAIWEIL